MKGFLIRMDYTIDGWIIWNGEKHFQCLKAILLNLGARTVNLELQEVTKKWLKLN